MEFIRTSYSCITGSNVFANNIKKVQGRYRLWRYIYDYNVEQPKLDPIPIKIKSNKELPLFRYMNASRLLSDIQMHKLSFISPCLWADPFEQLFFREEGVVIGGATYYIRCICFTYDWIESEEAAWNRSDDSQEVVRVEYNFEKLCDYLISFKEYKFYFSVMDYSMPRADIIKLSNGFKTKRWFPSSLDEYLNVMSLKRKAFSYENEIRLFMVSNKPFTQEIVKLDSSSLKVVSVCFPPKRQSVFPGLEKEMNAQKIKHIQSRLYDIK